MNFRGLFQSNWDVKIIALAIAALIWYFSRAL